jgi:DNA-binding transcriptional MerR regulator
MDQSYDYFTISDLAKDLDVKKSHIRFCEENRLISSRLSKLKRRVYNRYDRERLKFIFHFVLLGYSKEQIIELIGISNADLNENDQLKQGIEHGLKELKKLEQRKEELSISKQTRIINEIEMLREYIKKIKNIKSGIPEESSARPSMQILERTKIPDRAVTAITAKSQLKPTQHPVKVISLFIAGFVLVVLIGSYFYYQNNPKKTKTIKPVQKRPIHSEKILAPKRSESMNRTAKAQATVQESKPDSIQTSETASHKGDTVLRTEQAKNESSNVKVAVKDDTQKEVSAGELREKVLPAAEGEGQLTASVPESAEEKASEIEVKKVQEPGTAVATAQTAHGLSLASEKKELDSANVEGSSKDKLVREVDEERLKEKAMPDLASEDMLAASVTKPGVKKVPEIEVKPYKAESDKETEHLTSDNEINQQKNELSRLKSFLDEYCQAYTIKDVDKFISFFAPDATENNRPFHELVLDYRKNMESMEAITYRIDLMSYSKQTVSENLVIRGKFFTRYQSQEGVWKEQNGSILMELLKNGDSFLVKQLNYSE